MTTLVRANISEKNKYYINKHRHYELKHFCLQYPEWKRLYSELEDSNVSLSQIDRLPTSNTIGDPTAKRAMIKAHYSERINLIEKTARDTDKYLCNYILKAVTEGLSFPYLKARLDIPCGRDMYYDRYRRFFWLLDNSRN